MAYPLVLTLVVGVSLRAWLFRTPVAEWLAERNEISTPLTSWKRVTEGLVLQGYGISPYSGDILHEMPLSLRLFRYLNLWGSSIHIVFILLDLVTAIVLERIAKHLGRQMLKKQAENVKHYSTDSSKLLLTSQQLRVTRLYVVAAYLFNPYTIATCLAKSTAVFNNLAISLAILYTLNGSRGKASLFLALAGYMSFYPLMLVVPAAIYLAQRDAEGKGFKTDLTAVSLVQTCICTAAALTSLLYLSFMMEGSWSFLGSTYGFILSVPDLTPNMGLFWYFFTEMFEHFRFFFICVFQINAFIYTVPLAVRLKDNPIFMMYVLVALIAIFKSYPSYADTALYLSLLPLWKHVLPYMRNNFVVTVMLAVCTVMAPILWHLWVYAGSANANFYFAITLVYSTAQIFLVTDLLFAFLRREYDLIHGPKPPLINGKPAQVILD